MPSPKHLVNSQDLTKEDYDEILRRGMKFIDEGIAPDLCRGKVAVTLFLQPSTRTMFSFQSAIVKAGGGWIGTTDANVLSINKGETLEDTIRSIAPLCDCIVIRHPDEDSAERAASVSTVPVINGGSGSREHAVGAAMVMVALLSHLRKQGKFFSGLKVGIYGTPEINRCCKAIVPIFGYYGVDLVIDAFDAFPLPKEVEERSKTNGLAGLRYDKLDNFLGDVDVLLVTRGLQKGIIPEDKFPKERQELILKSYKPINTEHMKKMRPDALLYMLLPRIFEIEPEVDKDPRAVYLGKEPYMESALAVMTYLMGIEV